MPVACYFLEGVGDAQLGMEGADHSLLEPTQLGRGDLGTFCEVDGIEGQDVAGGDTMAVERGQQVREMLGGKSFGQNVMKVGHHRNRVSWGGRGQACRHLTTRESAAETESVWETRSRRVCCEAGWGPRRDSLLAAAVTA